MSRRRLAAAGAAVVVGVVLLIGLGNWQLRRLDWKEGLIAAAESRAHAAPSPAPSPADWGALKPADFEYRRVRLTGVYDYARQKLLFTSLDEPRGRLGGVGYDVMTPLTLPSGEAVIVDRGFVPEAMKADVPQGPRGEVTVVGLMRSSEARNWFTPADDLGRGVFYARDVGAMARAMGLSAHAPFVVDAEAGPDPLPQGGETRLTFVNNHLAYAATWYGMAAALVGVFGTYAFGAARRRA